MIHVADKRRVQAPSDPWWIMSAGIAPLFDLIAITFTTIQARNIVMSQLRQELSKLMANIAAGFDINSASRGGLNNNDFQTLVMRRDWFIAKDSVLMHIQDQGSRVWDMYNTIFDTEKGIALDEIGIFAISILADGFQIQAERDSNNNTRESPPVMPAELVRIRTGIFIKEVVDQYRVHLGKHWCQDRIDKVESDYQDLRVAYAREPNVKAAFDKHDEVFFNEA
jgi:hypothetical protein